MLMSGSTKAAINTATINANASQRSFFSWRCAGTPAVPGAISFISLHQMEGAAPARLVEEVQHGVTDESDAVADAGLLVLRLRRDKGPVHEQRPAYDVFARHKAPVAAVEADEAVVTHGKVFARRNDQLAILNVVRQFAQPLWRDFALQRRRV